MSKITVRGKYYDYGVVAHLEDGVAKMHPEIQRAAEQIANDPSIMKRTPLGTIVTENFFTTPDGFLAIMNTTLTDFDSVEGMPEVVLKNIPNVLD